MAKLQHPNIIPLFDAGEHQGVPYLFYAYIEGQTLEQLLKQEKSLPLVRSAEIACGVLEGLDYAHTQGVAHLDIKPANIMIAASGTPVGDVVAAVRELRPAFPVLLVSGYDTMRMVDNVLALGRVRFLRKPFTREELFAVLADVVRPNPGAQA